MSTLHNEEIRAMRQTVSLLRSKMALEPNQAEKIRIKKDIEELEGLIVKKLHETPDFANIRLEEDVY